MYTKLLITTTPFYKKNKTNKLILNLFCYLHQLSCTLSLSIGGSSSFIGDLLRRLCERSGDGELRFLLSPFCSCFSSVAVAAGCCCCSALSCCIGSSFSCCKKKKQTQINKQQAGQLNKIPLLLLLQQQLHHFQRFSLVLLLQVDPPASVLLCFPHWFFPLLFLQLVFPQLGRPFQLEAQKAALLKVLLRLSVKKKTSTIT